MSLNFKNILLESIIDGLESLSKLDKAVLKFIHNSMSKKSFNHTIGKNTYEMDATEALRVNDLIETFGLSDYDYVFKMWNFYKKFGNVLFDDDVFDDFSYTKADYGESVKLILARYYVDNIVGREIYPGWTVEMIEDPIGMVEEDLMSIFVVNKYNEQLFLNLVNLKGNGLEGEIITGDEDGLGLYFSDNLKVSKYNDVIATIGIPNPIRYLLNDLSNESLEEYFNSIIGHLQDEIEEWDEDIRYYYTEVEGRQDS